MNYINILNTRFTYYVLLGLNLLVSCSIFFLYRNSISGDHFTYLGLAEGMKRGIYSYWYFLDYYTPDTFRTPGYPLFLLFFKLFTENELLIKITQLCLYLVSIGLLLKCLKQYNYSYFLRNVFLIVLLPNVQIVYYTAYIFPEILMVFLLTFWTYLEIIKKDSIKYSTVKGIIFGMAFLVRPIFLFFPFLFVLMKILFFKNKVSLKHSIITIFVYCLSLIPYASWNYFNHGVFKVTSLEGGGGILHLGFWQHKLPNYYDERYWTTYYGNELIRFVEESNEVRIIADYNKEWNYIDSVCAPYLTEVDRLRLPIMEKNSNLFKTYSSAYTLKREEVLKRLTVMHIFKEPFYYFKVKIYSAIRLFVTGINPAKYSHASGLKDKLVILYPTIITASLFLLSVLVIPFTIFKLNLRNSWFLSPLFLVLYYWIIHIPMAIQSRYTIPIQMILIYILAISIFELIKLKYPFVLNYSMKMN